MTKNRDKEPIQGTYAILYVIMLIWIPTVNTIVVALEVISITEMLLQTPPMNNLKAK